MIGKKNELKKNMIKAKNNNIFNIDYLYISLLERNKEEEIR